MGTTARSRHTKSSAAINGVSPLLLSNCVQLADLGTAEVVRLAESSECWLVPQGTTLSLQREPVEDVYLLLEGIIRLEHFSDRGESLRHEISTPYAPFGDIVLLGEPNHRYTATASTLSVILTMPSRLLLEVLAANPATAIAWRTAINARLQRQEQATAGIGRRFFDLLTDALGPPLWA